MIGTDTYVPKNILDRLSDRKTFGEYILGFYHSECLSAGMKLVVVASALDEAFTQFQADLQRVSTFELNGGTPDHFKQMGHLVYWLRRCKPVVSIEPSPSFPPAGTDAEVQVMKDFQAFIMRYPNEYLAFSLGYKIGLIHVCTPNRPPSMFAIDLDYLNTICHVLWNKNVSPHSLFLNFKSLFLRPST